MADDHPPTHPTIESVSVLRHTHHILSGYMYKSARCKAYRSGVWCAGLSISDFPRGMIQQTSRSGRHGFKTCRT